MLYRKVLNFPFFFWRLWRIFLTAFESKDSLHHNASNVVGGVWMSVCLSVFLSVCSPACLPAYLSISVPACLPAYLSSSLPVSLPACLDVLCALRLLCFCRLGWISAFDNVFRRTPFSSFIPWSKKPSQAKLKEAISLSFRFRSSKKRERGKEGKKK